MRRLGLTMTLAFALAAAGCAASDKDTPRDAGADAATDARPPDGTPGDGGCQEPTSTTRLESVKVTTPPTLDGVAEPSVWGCLPTLEVTVTANTVYKPRGAPKSPSYPGLTRTKVRMKSVYTATHVYFLATWDDPTLSLARYPWEKQADGTWKQLTNKDSSGHENTYYEDKLAIQWNISSPSFVAQGCFAGCHAKVSDDKPGKKYNPKGEVTDMWHWKSVRTEPNGQLDDKHVSYVESGKCSGQNCRLADSKTAGGYKDNNYAKFKAGCAGDPDGTKNLPCFMGPKGAEKVANNKYWILDSEKQPFKDTAFMKGDQIAGMVTAPFVGSRGDVSTRARYAGGKWTLEIKRALTTAAGKAEDVQFDDLSKSYAFGVAVFDNTQINHASHGGALTLTFRK